MRTWFLAAAIGMAVFTPLCAWGAHDAATPASTSTVNDSRSNAAPAPAPAPAPQPVSTYHAAATGYSAPPLRSDARSTADTANPACPVTELCAGTASGRARQPGVDSRASAEESPGAGATSGRVDSPRSGAGPDSGFPSGWSRAAAAVFRSRAGESPGAGATAGGTDSSRSRPRFTPDHTGSPGAGSRSLSGATPRPG